MTYEARENPCTTQRGSCKNNMTSVLLIQYSEVELKHQLTPPGVVDMHKMHNLHKEMTIELIVSV